MLRILILTIVGTLALYASGCTNSNPNKVASASNRDRKIYYAHDVRTGSHMQQAFTEPTPTPDPSSVLGGVQAGDRPFANSSAAGSYAGQH